jgi:hypothetical protein
MLLLDLYLLVLTPGAKRKLLSQQTSGFITMSLAVAGRSQPLADYSDEELKYIVKIYTQSRRLPENSSRKANGTLANGKQTQRGWRTP